MNKDKARERLEVVTNVAVLLVAVSILVILALNYFAGQKPAPRLVEGLQRGQQLPAISGVDYNGTSPTLLIAMNTKCSYCTESIPFYNQIANMRNTGKISPRAVAIFPNSDGEVQRYARQYQLNIDYKSSIQFDDLKLAGTPTMILVDQKGKVINFWVGALKPEAQKQFLDSLTTSRSDS